MTENKIRLQKFLSEAGVASRRKAEEMIRSGKVKVNGSIAQIGDSVDPKKDTVTVSGKRVRKETNLRYILLNKPRGYVTTMSDELGRKCVAELVQDGGATVYPVGRLDRDTEGLLIITDDGDFAFRMLRPEFGITKRYFFRAFGEINEEKIKKLQK